MSFTTIRKIREVRIIEEENKELREKVNTLKYEIECWKSMKSGFEERATDYEQKIKILKAENTELKEKIGNLDSMYQYRMLDLEARIHKKYKTILLSTILQCPNCGNIPW